MRGRWMLILGATCLLPIEASAANSSATLQPVAMWGSLGSGPGQFNGPIGLDVDAQGNVYVVDLGNSRIQRFSNDGVFVSQWGAPGAGDGQFDQPQDICVVPNGSVYVLEDQNQRVQRFSPAGVFEGKWGHWGSCDGEFENATGICADGNSNIYVADRGNERVQKFDENGAFLLKWGSWPDTCDPGSYVGPRLGAQDVVALEGSIVVADRYNDQLTFYSPDGVAGASFPCSGPGSYPRGLAVDGQARLYVADFDRNVVQVFTKGGSLVMEFGGAGESAGQFNTPTSIAVDRAGNVFVADFGNNRIQKFAAAGITPIRRVTFGQLKQRYR